MESTVTQTRQDNRPAPASADCLVSRKIVQPAILYALPLLLAALLFWTYPFSDTLSQKSFSLSALTAPQKSNIRAAAKAIDGCVVAPGETFSFNQVVGPRTDLRGYRKAPAYIGQTSAPSMGGGICLLSSAVYQAALESNLRVLERTPHTATVRSVQAGLDSTVWYGVHDLRLQNTLAFPIRINAQWEQNAVKVSILGKQQSDWQASRLETVIVERDKQKLLVDSFRVTNDKRELISRDSYSAR